MVGHQSLEQRGDDLGFDDAADELEVERLGVADIADEEDFLAVGALDVGLALARGEQSEENRQENRGESPHAQLVSLTAGAVARRRGGRKGRLGEEKCGKLKPGRKTGEGETNGRHPVCNR